MSGALAVLALPAAACHAQESASDVAFGKRVRGYLLAHPEVLREAFEQLQVKEAAQKAVGARAAIASRRNLLERDPRDPVLGNPHGKVTVVEFFDYRCPFCKAAEPGVEKLLADNPDVRLVLKQFPILDLEDQTHVSEDATRAAGHVRLLTVIVLLTRQFGAVRTDGRDEFGRCDFVAHFAVNARLAFIDFDQKNAFAIFCRFEAQRAKFARRCVVVFGEQGH